MSTINIVLSKKKRHSLFPMYILSFFMHYFRFTKKPFPSVFIYKHNTNSACNTKESLPSWSWGQMLCEAWVSMCVFFLQSKHWFFSLLCALPLEYKEEMWARQGLNESSFLSAVLLLHNGQVSIFKELCASCFTPQNLSPTLKLV